jgi:DNA-binding NarL/FixJ family response regulator
MYPFVVVKSDTAHFDVQRFAPDFAVLEVSGDTAPIRILRSQARVVLIVIGKGDEERGLQLAASILRLPTAPRVGLIVERSSEDLAIRALRIGVHGYWRAPAAQQDLVSFLESATADSPTPGGSRAPVSTTMAVAAPDMVVAVPQSPALQGLLRQIARTEVTVYEARQKASDQRSIRFDEYNGRTVLAITGNYYAAYSADQRSKDQRARDTFLAVVEPILQVAVPKFQTNSSVQGYAVEVSHHIVGKIMGVSMERPENLMAFFPQNAALKLLAAKDDTARQAALLDAQLFLNAEPVTIWLEGQGPQAGLKPTVPDAPEVAVPASQIGGQIVNGNDSRGAVGNIPLTFPKHAKPVDDVPHPQPRDTSPEALASLQAANKQMLETMVKELDAQAHFVPYAAPNFIVFRQNIFLELSLTTSLNDAAAGSRYRLAAMAFDDHIAHLVRPVLGYFKPDPKQEFKFDGIGFSTTVHVSGKDKNASGSEAIEFFFPLSALRCYESYDCTGQQLIDAGLVLINGERVSLDLQIAEGSAR